MRDPVARVKYATFVTPAALLLSRLGERNQVVAPHVEGGLRAQIAAEMIVRGEVVVIVGQDGEDAEALYRDLCFLLGLDEEHAPDQGLLFFPADDKSPYEESTPDGRTTMERLATLHRLSTEPKSVKAVVASPQALLRRHVAPDYFNKAGDYVLAGADLDRDGLLAKLTATGYNSVSTVEDPGTFSVRGGIIDIFSPHRTRPVRIDLFGDEVDSIRHFDPQTQRNLGKLEEATILPAREIAFEPGVADRAVAEIEAIAEEATIPTRKLHAIIDDVQNHLHFFGIESLLPIFHEEGLVSAAEYLPRGPGVVYLLPDADDLAGTDHDAWTEAQLDYERTKDRHMLAVAPERHLASAEEVVNTACESTRSASFVSLALEGSKKVELKWEDTRPLRNEILQSSRSRNDSEDVLQPLVHRLKRWRSERFTTLIACSTRGQAERLKSMLEPKDVEVRLLKTRFDLAAFQNDQSPLRAQLRDRNVHAFLVLGEISSGFALKTANLAVISEEEIFGQKVRRRRRNKRPTGARVSDLQDLSPGDFVVHVDYGIGHYRGMTKLAVNGVESDYLHIEYKGKDTLYLPVHRLRLISKYASASEVAKSPTLDKLGGTTWATTKRRVKDTLLKMAAELLRLYAVRQNTETQALPPPDETYQQFESEFPFEATPDQQKAIDDALRDMQQTTPMDRLISGDVGFGKTEVAMRAAMLALLGKKQVAVLVPTTVLAAQHHQVFSARFANYPVNVEIVSRFQTKEEVKKTLAGLKEGKVDIIIGTHRLLSKDVVFKDIGLMVVDEEHRFGVRHKETLKKYRSTVHVLSMSATPIPRTLHMGFMGVRDMSMITTAPQDRLAVKTEVHRFDEDAIRDAIMRELKRGGQVFFVHNRVASIFSMAKFLEKLVPEARIGVGHGQMDEDRLEKVMVDFMNKEFNVLLSTTIIESGIDIPNANTILVNRSDRLGLAQLYQLRGRVGRGTQRGFCYFLIPAGNLTKKARARIGVLQRFTELGSGFKVASKDLEIRGAGNLLGKQQSGTIAAVGFDMYQALLKEAISELQGSARSSLKEPEVQVPLPAFIPDNYVKPPGERLSYYQRLNKADSDEATYDVLQELTDIYGTPPGEVENLVELLLVKQRLGRLGASNLDFGAETKAMPARIVIRFDPEETTLDPAKLVRWVQDKASSRKMVPDGRLMLYLVPYEDPREILQQAKVLLGELILLGLSKNG